ncbi:hypothetical protein Q8F55_005116 [Vanrija albida]|uniref:Peptidase M20 dimerisation domain-containing protein n=1 Tax=Vanrija albida TaxID=181172 RepID=A0ABR3Q0R3_9TREE
MEKQKQQHTHELPAPVGAEAKSRSRTRPLLLALLLLAGLVAHRCLFRGAPAPAPAARGCEQAAPLLPTAHDVSSVWGAKERVIKWHQDAIRIPTQSWDDMGAPGDDPRWDVFADYHAYLETAYPLVHRHLSKTTIDTWGLVYEWVGSDAGRRPLFITGHQDVVPVLPDTVNKWEHPPYSGDYDGTYIWGRGASDDKSTTTAVLAAIELLLEVGDFKPSRTVVLAFGHDEERGGLRGAMSINDYLLDKYGPQPFALLVDEGSGLSTAWGRTFGLPGVAEKGKFDLNLTVSTLGGHSSVPPPHTGIGLSALLIAELERNPCTPSLGPKAPVYGFLQCAASYAPEIPSKLKRVVAAAASGCKKAARALPDLVIETGLGGPGRRGAGQGSAERALMSTTQAVDIINGGVKVNALPELVTTLVNHRIDISSRVAEVKSRIWHTLQPVAAELGLAVQGFNRSYTPDNARGTVYLSSSRFGADLEPAPITDFTVANPAWRVFAGTARGLWASRKEVSSNGTLVDLAPEDELIMAPFMTTGNTDTARYWALAKDIFRWRYVANTAHQGGHTINERIEADALVEFTRFFQALILNVDADDF